MYRIALLRPKSWLPLRPSGLRASLVLTCGPEFWGGNLVTVYEDNQATMRIIQTGKYPKLRHVSRLHGVNISWLRDLYRRKHYDIFDTHTKRQAGDVFTKHFTSVPSWNHAMSLIGVMCDSTVSSIFTNHIVYGRVQNPETPAS